MASSNTTNNIPRIVRGNDFTLKVNVKKAVLNDGETVLEDFTLDDSTDITVNLVTQLGKRTNMPYTASGSTLLVDFDETVASGLYGIEVTGKQGGKDWRFYAMPGELLQIVEPTSAAYIPSDDTVDGYYSITAELGVVSISDEIIRQQVNSAIDEKIAGALIYKGTVSSNDDLPSESNIGDTYVVAEAGTYAGKNMEIGDYLIWNGASWDGINGENQVENKDTALSVGEKSTIATVDGTDITVTVNADSSKVDKEGGKAKELTVYNDSGASALTIATEASGDGGIRIVPRSVENSQQSRARIMFVGDDDSYIDIPTLTSGATDTLALQSAIPAVDSELSSTSTNAVQNKAVQTAISNIDSATTLRWHTGDGEGSVSSTGSAGKATGENAVSEGSSTSAAGNNSHAGGDHTNATAKDTFAHGTYVNACNAGEVAFGTYNKSVTSNTAAEQTIFSVGNGTSMANRSSAIEIKKDGKVYIQNVDSDLATTVNAKADATHSHTISDVTDLQNDLDAKVDKDGGTADNLTVNGKLTVSATTPDDDGVTSSFIITPGAGGDAVATANGAGSLIFPFVEEGSNETVALLSDITELEKTIAALKERIKALEDANAS